jgi:hypothetical protein
MAMKMGETDSQHIKKSTHMVVITTIILITWPPKIYKFITLINKQTCAKVY